ncbi:hypothetical protein INT44_002205 [Umbelopsis vinacea]|uniref:RING-type domain-containing protein n=1 Tax=Umbelopsis vinacea TaxID=44442 RepID=A0A8H7Q2U1_9FUNG|nr:hypothetical protein INT44_002205 [Umbelopsis vinacea]
MKTLAPFLRFSYRASPPASKSTILLDGQHLFECPTCIPHKTQNISNEKLYEAHSMLCDQHKSILQSIESTHSTLNTLIRESRNFTTIMQDLASSYLATLDAFNTLDVSCIAEFEERLMVMSFPDWVPRFFDHESLALNPPPTSDLVPYLSHMLGSISINDDAMKRWILYLEIQAQQQYEEQFRHLKALFLSCSPSLDDFTCAICLSIYHDPTKLPSCSHNFCRSCLDQCPPLRKTWAPDQPRACPLCRTPFLLSQCCDDTEIARALKAFFPKQLKKKQKEYSKERVRERWQRFLRGTVYTSSGDTLYTITGSVIIAWHENPESVDSDQRARAEIMSFVAWPF